MVYQKNLQQNVSGQVLEYRCNNGFVFTDIPVAITTPVPTTTTTSTTTTITTTTTTAPITGVLSGSEVSGHRWKDACRVANGAEITGLSGETTQSCCDMCRRLHQDTDWISVKKTGDMCNCYDKVTNDCSKRDDLKNDGNAADYDVG